MSVYGLLGLPYRLGAEPAQHQAADCLSLARAVLTTYDIATPAPQREWYRRLRRGDYTVFDEQLQLWGQPTDCVARGTVALCRLDTKRLGLATYFEDEPGWIGFAGQAVSWFPLTALQVEKLYCPQKSS